MPVESGGGGSSAAGTTTVARANLGGVSSTLAAAFSLQTLLSQIPAAQNPAMTPYSFSVGGAPAAGAGSQPRAQGQGINLGLQPLQNMAGQATGNQTWQIYPSNPPRMFAYPAGAINSGGFVPPMVVDPRSEEARLLRTGAAQQLRAAEYLSRRSGPSVIPVSPDVWLEPGYGFNTAARGYPFGGGPTTVGGGGGGGGTGGSINRSFGGGRGGTDYNPMVMGLINWRI